MRILIMVLGSAKEHYWKLLSEQQVSWANKKYDGIEVLYYYGTPEKEYGNAIAIGNNTIAQCSCSDAYNMMHVKFKDSLIYANRKDYDFIFRTNSSSYVDKKQLLAFAQTLPAERTYCGINGGGFASGSGFFISRDCAEILAREIPEEPHGAEDICIGQVLAKHGIGVTDCAKRVDFDTVDQQITPCYHYRCKMPDYKDTIKIFERLKEYHAKL